MRAASQEQPLPQTEMAHSTKKYLPGGQSTHQLMMFSMVTTIASDSIPIQIHMHEKEQAKEQHEANSLTLFSTTS